MGRQAEIDPLFLILMMLATTFTLDSMLHVAPTGLYEAFWTTYALKNSDFGPKLGFRDHKTTITRARPRVIRRDFF